MTDLSTVPLVALSDVTKQLVSTLLNPTKVIPTDDGLPRDWRGLAHLSGLSGETIPNLSSQPDPCKYILNKMQEKAQGFTMKHLQTLLEQLDRWDIIDDTLALMESDAQQFTERLQRSQTSAEDIEDEVDRQMLTVDDIYRHRQGLESQYYDAFVLYADQDSDFVAEVIENLENKHKLKLCLKDRDLIGGVTFEHEAVMQLIKERCNRLIVIVSPSFLKSPANHFFLNYAQALGIDKRRRKVIPCVYQRCELPEQLRYYFILDHNKGDLYDFWGKLKDSVQAPSTSRGYFTSAKSPADSRCTKVSESCSKNKASSSHLSEEAEDASNRCNGESRLKCTESSGTLGTPDEASKENNCTTELNGRLFGSNNNVARNKKYRNPFWFGKKKKLLPSVDAEEDAQKLPDLKHSRSLASLDVSEGSTLSLPSVAGKKKPKNIIYKYVNRVKSLVVKS